MLMLMLVVGCPYDAAATAAVGPPGLPLPAAPTSLLLLCPAIAARLLQRVLVVVVVPPVRAVSPRPVRHRRRHALPPPLQAGVEQVLHQHYGIHCGGEAGRRGNRSRKGPVSHPPPSVPSSTLSHCPAPRVQQGQAAPSAAAQRAHSPQMKYWAVKTTVGT